MKINIKAQIQMLPRWRQGLKLVVVARYFTFTAPVSDLLEWLVSSLCIHTKYLLRSWEREKWGRYLYQADP